MSIPRMKLSAAHFVSKTLLYVKEIKIDEIIAFSDSKVTVAWLSKPANTWNVFVTNNVAEIQEKFPEIKHMKSRPAQSYFLISVCIIN